MNENASHTYLVPVELPICWYAWFYLALCQNSPLGIWNSSRILLPILFCCDNHVCNIHWFIFKKVYKIIPLQCLLEITLETLQYWGSHLRISIPSIQLRSQKGYLFLDGLMKISFTFWFILPFLLVFFSEQHLGTRTFIYLVLEFLGFHLPYLFDWKYY